MDSAEMLAQIPYQKPPAALRAILDAPATPSLSVSPTRDYGLLYRSEEYPPIQDLARPTLRLAGLRLDPVRRGPHAQPHVAEINLLSLADGKSHPLDVPAGSRLTSLDWSNDGRWLAFTQATAAGLALGVAAVPSGQVDLVPGLKINAAYGEPFQWLPDGKTLLCQQVPPDQGQPPLRETVPPGPHVQETAGKEAPVRTYQDLLHDTHDEALFDYYTTSQLVLVDRETQKFTPLGKPAIFHSVTAAPNGNYFLVERLVRPYSYLLPVSRFPREVEIWDRSGQVIHKLASLPLADEIPIEGVAKGPRHLHWLPTAPATLVWVEALDEGDPNKKVPFRDRLLAQSAPFQAEPKEWFKTEHRFFGLTWGEAGLAFVRDYDRDRRWQRTFLLNREHPERGQKVLWDHSIHEHYQDPGSLVLRRLPSGGRIVQQNGDAVFLIGAGASPEGDRPFLDRFDLKTEKTTRLFQCEPKCYERPLALLNREGSHFLTRHETPHEPPNYFVRQAETGTKRALTTFTDPTPQLRQIKKQLVSYQRPDGVPLSFTLYLPPDYHPGQRLPAVVWAYPREYNDARTAGQVTGSPYRFTSISGPSQLFFLLQGYAVLDSATMPVVGAPATANNTYIEQIVSSAKAAIDKADDMGILDRNRVGIGGHSYGAFMTANLLAHSDLFRAGIARSGAYNRTLTPFGFQNERRTLWEAPQIYFQMSPFLHADKIKAPLLLLHGEADNNSGTFPMQSERMYHAIKGNAGTARLVILPHEAHGYRARESVEHTLFEMMAWFDRYVKQPKGAK